MDFIYFALILLMIMISDVIIERDLSNEIIKSCLLIPYFHGKLRFTANYERFASLIDKHGTWNNTVFMIIS